MSGHLIALPSPAALQRLNRATDSVTVSYRRVDGLYATTVGYGRTLKERIAHADAQLPPGTWTREAVSTPMSIYTDVLGREPLPGYGERSRNARTAYPYERQVIHV